MPTVSHNVVYKQKSASVADIEQHLLLCDQSFNPPLSSYVNINSYSVKIYNNAQTFEAWCDEKLIGLIAVYCNDRERNHAFITNVSVLPDFSQQGIASNLIEMVIEFVREIGFGHIDLEVYSNNHVAVCFYQKCRFIITERAGDKYFMSHEIK